MSSIRRRFGSDKQPQVPPEEYTEFARFIGRSEVIFVIQIGVPHVGRIRDPLLAYLIVYVPCSKPADMVKHTLDELMLQPGWTAITHSAAFALSEIISMACNLASEGVPVFDDSAKTIISP